MIKNVMKITSNYQLKALDISPNSNYQQTQTNIGFGNKNVHLTKSPYKSFSSLTDNMLNFLNKIHDWKIVSAIRSIFIATNTINNAHIFGIKHSISKAVVNEDSTGNFLTANTDKTYESKDLPLSQTSDASAAEVYIDKRIEEALMNKPTLNTYHSIGTKSVKNVRMGNYLTVNATEDKEYIGTSGLGMCIGLAIINKKAGKLLNMSIAHISACIDLNSLERLFYAMNNPSELDVTLISSWDNKDLAKDVLYQLLKSDMGKKIKNISVDLTYSNPNSNLNYNYTYADFAVNTQTGEISSGIPLEDLDDDEMHHRAGISEPLHKSSHQTL